MLAIGLGALLCSTIIVQAQDDSNDDGPFVRLTAPPLCDRARPTRYGTAAILQEARRSHLEIAPVSGAEWEQLIADIYRTPADVVEETKAVLR